MTKSELIKHLSRIHRNHYQKDITRLVEIIFREIGNAMVRGDRVELRGFGAFSVRRRKPRQARNPRTNKTVQLNERFAPYFRAGKGLRDRINNPANTSAGAPTSNMF